MIAYQQQGGDSCKQWREMKQEYDLGADTQHLKRKICLNDDTPTWVSLTWGHILFLVNDRWVAKKTIFQP